MVGTRDARSRGKLGRVSAKKQRETMKSLAVAKSPGKPKPKMKTPVKEEKKATPAKATPAKKVSKKVSKKEEEDDDLPSKVRVWWPPTNNKAKSDLSGMYWPAKVVSKSGASSYIVKYDNGETEKAPIANCVPYDQVVKHGKEKTPLKEGEFCEVLNGSSTDPAEWLARIVSQNGKKYTVSFPFHDAEGEAHPESRIRRARVWDAKSETWFCINPKQAFKDAQVENPNELKRCTDEAIEKYSPAEKTPVKVAKPPSKKTSQKPAKAADKIKPAPKAPKAAKDPAAKAAKAAKDPAAAAGAAGAAPEKKKRKREEGLVPVLVGDRTIMVPSSPPREEKPEDDKKKKRKLKDKDAPKKALSAYLVFLSRTRASVKKKHPSFSVSEVTTECAKLWKEVTADERMKCVELAAEDKVRYEKEMAEYKKPPPPAEGSEDAEGGAGGEAPKGKKRKKKDKDAPRKSRSAYILFSMDYREKNKKALEEAGFNNSSKIIGESWGKLKDTERRKWVDLADKESALYKEEMFAYKEEKAATEAKERDAARLAYAVAQVEREQAEKKATAKAEKAAMKEAKAAAKGGSGAVPLGAGAELVGPGGIPISMPELRAGVMSVCKNDKAYYLLVDAIHGEGRARVVSALGHAVMNDWKGFIIGALGMDKVKSSLKPDKP